MNEYVDIYGRDGLVTQRAVKVNQVDRKREITSH
jgi:hypothetical protein